MNARLHHFTKPWIALLDGIAMGGGVGVSVHGSLSDRHRAHAVRDAGDRHRPVSRRRRDLHACRACPGARALPRPDRRAARRRRLPACGHRHGPVAADRLDALEDALAAADLRGDAFAEVDAVLARFESDPGPAPIADLRDRIDRCFGRESLAAVRDALVDETLWLGRGAVRGAGDQVADQPRRDVSPAAPRRHTRLRWCHAARIPSCPSLHGRS